MANEDAGQIRLCKDRIAERLTAELHRLADQAEDAKNGPAEIAAYSQGWADDMRRNMPSLVKAIVDGPGGAMTPEEEFIAVTDAISQLRVRESELRPIVRADKGIPPFEPGV